MQYHEHAAGAGKTRRVGGSHISFEQTRVASGYSRSARTYCIQHKLFFNQTVLFLVLNPVICLSLCWVQFKLQRLVGQVI